MSVIVYLDQNKWIELLRQHKGIASNQETQRILNVVEACSEDKSAIFPLSLIHIRETATSHNKKNRRIEMFEFMTEVSKLYGLAPRDVVQTEELHHFVSEQLGRQDDVMNRVLGEGIPFILAGNHWSIETDHQEMTDALEEFAETAEAFEMLLEDETMEEFGKKRDQKFVQELEEIRRTHEEAFGNNNEIRRRFAPARYFRDEIAPELAALLVANGRDLSVLDVDLNAFVKGLEDGAQAENLLKQFPTSYTYTTLTVTRDLQRHRKIQQNDLDDIMALSVAIPYCDVVITENFWAHEARSQGLDDVYDTVVSSDLKSILSILDK